MNTFKMQEVTIDSFLENLKHNNISFFEEVLHFVHKHLPHTLDDLLIKLSQEDDPLLQNIQRYISSHKNYFDKLPEIAQKDLLEKFNLVNEYIVSETPPIAQRYALFWNTLSCLTTEKITDFPQKTKTYNTLLSDVKKDLNLSALNEIELNFPQKRVFIFMLYVGGKHAPSVIADQWAQTFKELNCQVIIVSHTPSAFIYPTNISWRFNKALKTGESKQLDENIFLMEIGGDLLYKDIFLQFIETVHLNKKDIYLAIGEASLAFDLLPFQNKYFIPVTLKGQKALTSATNYIHSRDIGLHNLFMQPMHYFKGPSEYTSDETTRFQPPQITSDQTIHIAIIGNRLKFDLTQKFWDAIQDLHSNIPNIKLHIIGKLSSSLLPYEVKKYVKIAGFQEDLQKYLHDIHFYLNPPRDGGGHSAAIAIKNGIPIITLPKGDVYEIIKQKYSITSLNEIAQFIKAYISDDEFKQFIDKSNEELLNTYNSRLEIIYDTAQKILDSSSC